MTKLAILGANGQVGAELCLLFARMPGIELIPVCRTRSGSAFLRWQGIACRHGRVADPAEAPALIGDCDVIVNCILSTGSPRDMRRAEDQVSRAIARLSRADAVIVHLSTQSVYGDAAPGRWRWRNPYGRAKLATERTLRRACATAGRQCFILRLGHVCGPLQNISSDIRERILRGEVILPRTEGASNTVYTVTIRDAVLMAISAKFRPGIYDLMNVPQWSWRKVYACEAAAVGVELQANYVDVHPRPSPVRRLVALSGLPIHALAAAPWWRDLMASAIAYMPLRLSRHAHAWWQRSRARREIAALSRPPQLPEGLDWRTNGSVFPPGMPTTEDSLAASPYGGLLSTNRCWPEDLPKSGARTRDVQKPADQAQSAIP
jgi:nucleoside-diphosphate-sugar epimerase